MLVWLGDEGGDATSPHGGLFQELVGDIGISRKSRFGRHTFNLAMRSTKAQKQASLLFEEREKARERERVREKIRWMSFPAADQPLNLSRLCLCVCVYSTYTLPVCVQGVSTSEY